MRGVTALFRNMIELVSVPTNPISQPLAARKTFSLTVVQKLEPVRLFARADPIDTT